jgi:ech hydrogenase subunit C
MSSNIKVKPATTNVLHFDCGSCNGCDIEVLASLLPKYGAQNFGIKRVGKPEDADVLILTGPVNYRNKKILENIYSRMRSAKLVMAVGECACSGAIFHNCPNTLGGIDKVVPVDVYIPGCAARPEQIIDGAVLLLQKVASITKDGAAD